MPGNSTADADDESQDESDDDKEGTMTQRGARAWQAEALTHTEAIRKKHKKYELFCKTELLDRIRCDCKLNHSHISEAGSSTKKRKKSSKNEDSGEAGGDQGKKRKADDDEEKQDNDTNEEEASGKEMK